MAEVISTALVEQNNKTRQYSESIIYICNNSPWIYNNPKTKFWNASQSLSKYLLLQKKMLIQLNPAGMLAICHDAD